MGMNEGAHAIIVPFAAWGHVRPLLHLTLNILILHPSLRVTLLLAPSVRTRVDAELASPSCAHIYTPLSGSPAGERLQVLTVKHNELDLPEDFEVARMGKDAEDYMSCFTVFLDSLCKADERVEGIENRFSGMKPSFIMFDLFQSFVPDVVSSLKLPQVPTLLGFIPSYATPTFHHFASEANGGFITLYRSLAAKEVANGMDELDALAKVMFTSQGETKTLPGLPTMYDFEYFPMARTVPAPPPALREMCKMRDAAYHPMVTALVVPATRELEPEASTVLEKELGKPVLMAGMQFPENVWDRRPSPRPTTGDAGRVIAFLDEMEARYGKKSVLYGSFGSMFYPVLRPELVEYIFSSLQENGVPFVWAYASEFANLTPDFVDKINSHPDSCLVKFAPQWAVLEHEAVGSFLSHCGSNSAAEAIIAEVPIISVPFGADQAEISLILTDVCHVAIELAQMKSPKEDYHPKLYRGVPLVGTEKAIKDELADVLKRIRGAEGEEMRENMRVLRRRCEASWRNGESRKAMEGFARYF